MKTGLFLFTNDLRIQDNWALAKAARQCQYLLLVYVDDRKAHGLSKYYSAGQGLHRHHFIEQALNDLSIQLQPLNQQLIVKRGQEVESLASLIQEFSVDAIYYSEHSDYEFRYQMAQLQQAVQQKMPQPLNSISWHGVWQHTLFEAAQLPFSIDELPQSFTPFRKLIEHQLPEIERPLHISELPPPPASLKAPEFCLEPKLTAAIFEGGSLAANVHLDAYFHSSLAQTYKQSRDAIDDWSSSTKLSPWLAVGCLSVRQVYQALKQHEQVCGSNDSTYWIFFELLWREYFHWRALSIKSQLFDFSGTAKNKPLSSFHAERFTKWKTGSTPFPLVNAIMNQLNATGFIANRARQIAASCFVNELALDWRFGAAYFQQQLIDYDAAVNWGNWQYIAGVGADPRGGRHFNLDKQEQLFDPNGEYVERWQGMASVTELDSTDMVDWPVLSS